MGVCCCGERGRWRVESGKVKVGVGVACDFGWVC